MAEKQAIMQVEYRISQEEFGVFSTLSMNRQYADRARRTNFTGIIKLAVGVVLMAYILYVQAKGGLSALNSEIVLVLAVAVLGYGIYSFSYYRWIFPWLVKRSAREGYEKSSYLQNPIQITFYSTGFEEVSQGKPVDYRWQQFRRIVLVDDIYMLELREGGRTILIPRSSLGEDKYLLDELLGTVCAKYKLSLDTVY